MTMAIRDLPQVKTRRYTADEVWAMACDPANEGRYFYLIDGELFEDPMPNWPHSELAALISHLLLLFVRPRNLGSVHVELGAHPPDSKRTLLVPDVAFNSSDRQPIPRPKGYAPIMPDLAVEIKSPNNSMPELRRKAETYLRHGGEIVWLVLPEREGIEQWTLDADGRMQSQFIDRDGEVSGGAALPSFTLPLRELFPKDSEGDENAS